jgi:L-seryl-tRNA(Ser) seleniumtransferase
MDRDALRRLPPVGAVLEDEALRDTICARGRATVLSAVRAAIDEARSGLLAGLEPPADQASLARRSLAIIERESPQLQPVLNATGILLHTGLGRAPLAEEAITAVVRVAQGYCNLELDLEAGQRGRRTAGIEKLVCALTGAEAATAVNNNAGATVLALRALAFGKEVIVSRGQLVEIGGGFRLPEIFEVSGARLREVGTTNKTRLTDYEQALGPLTAAILRVHRSNFRMVGFTEEPELIDLARLAHDHGLWTIDDVGSGALKPGLPPDVGDEPTVADGIAAGADLVLFSGDKLLGGPQCGIMAGNRKAIAQVEADPLMRALRLDKMTLAALEVTLHLARDPDWAADRIPLWRMMAMPLSTLSRRASSLASALASELGANATVVPAESFIGGGSAPLQGIPTMAVAIAAPFPAPFDSETSLARALRQGDPPVVARVQKGLVLFDLRTIPLAQDPDLLDAVRKVCHDRRIPVAANGPVPAG